MNEFASIRRGENPAWDGDRILNSETYLKWLARDQPEVARGLVDDLTKNFNDYVEETGLSPRSVGIAIIELSLEID